MDREGQGTKPTAMIKVIYRGVVYNSIDEAAASTGANSVDLHKEMLRAAITGERFYTDEGDGYLSEEEASEDPDHAGKISLIRFHRI